MSSGKVVFDGAPNQLTPDAVKNLYGIEADATTQQAPVFNLAPAQMLPPLQTLPTAQIH
jgi:hypothetical protein